MRSAPPPPTNGKDWTMKRRDLLKTGLTAGAAATLASGGLLGGRADPAPAAAAQHQFKLKYAPHFGMFEALAGPDPIDQIKFMAD